MPGLIALVALIASRPFPILFVFLVFYCTSVPRVLDHLSNGSLIFRLIASQGWKHLYHWFFYSRKKLPVHPLSVYLS